MDGRDEEGSTEEYETLIQTTDVELLKRVWRQEKAAPEILKFKTDLIARLTGHIELVMDLDRTQFLLRSYLRIRLQKIEKYIFHILATGELYNQLSKQEKAFAKTCLVDLEKHLEESVLSKLPNNYQSIFKQSMISEEIDMGIIFASGNQRPLEEPFEMEPNVLYFVRYKAIKRFEEEGRIGLF